MKVSIQGDTMQVREVKARDAMPRRILPTKRIEDTIREAACLKALPGLASCLKEPMKEDLSSPQSPQMAPPEIELPAEHLAPEEKAPRLLGAKLKNQLKEEEDRSELRLPPRPLHKPEPQKSKALEPLLWEIQADRHPSEAPG